MPTEPTNGPTVTLPRAEVIPDEQDNKPRHIDDGQGHQWQTVWRSSDGRREAQHCVDHGECAAKRFRDGPQWTLADVAPWVDKQHVEVHARAMLGRRALARKN